MKTIHQAIASIMRGMVAIGKTKSNQQQGFKYRGIDDAYNALQPLLAENGVFTVPEVLERVREERINKNGTVLAFTCLRIKYTFYSEDGSSVSCIVEGEGMDSGDKSSNKAMAVGHKYALLQTFMVPTEITDDPDAQVHEIKPARSQQTATVQPKIDEQGWKDIGERLLEYKDGNEETIKKMRDLLKSLLASYKIDKVAHIAEYTKLVEKFQVRSEQLKKLAEQQPQPQEQLVA